MPPSAEALDIIANDPLNLFEKKTSKPKSETERLIDSFAEIVEFVDEHGRLPTRSKDDIIEFALACRLEGIKANEVKRLTIKGDERFKDSSILRDNKTYCNLD